MDCDSLTALGSPPAGLVRRETRWRIAAVAIVLAVYAAGWSGQWWIGPDSGLYLNLARNILRGEGYTIAGRPHVHVPPGFPFYLTGMMSMGLGGFAALNAAMMVIGLGTVLAAYMLLRELVDSRWAMLIAAVFALSREMTQRSGEVLSDVPFMFVAVTALMLYQRGLRGERPDRRGWEAASLLLVASCWVRAAAFPLAAGAMVGLVLAGWKKARARALVNAIIVVAGLAGSAAFFLWYIHGNTPTNAPSYLGTLSGMSKRFAGMGLLTTPLTQVYVAGGQVCRLLIAQRMPLAVVLVVVTLPIAAAIVRRIARGDLLIPLAAVCYIAGVCVAGSIPRTRYFLPIAPVLILYWLEGWAWGAALVARKVPAVRAATACVLLVVLLGMNSPLVARDLINKRRPDYATNQQRGRYVADCKVVEFLSEHRPPPWSCVLAEPHVAYLADVPAPTLPRDLEESSPTPQELAELLAYWRIAYAVVSAGNDAPAMHRALAEYLGWSAPPVFAYDDLRVYRVGEPADENALGPQTRPDSADEGG